MSSVTDVNNWVICPIFSSACSLSRKACNHPLSVNIGVCLFLCCGHCDFHSNYDNWVKQSRMLAKCRHLNISRNSCPSTVSFTHWAAWPSDKLWSMSPSFWPLKRKTLSRVSDYTLWTDFGTDATNGPWGFGRSRTMHLVLRGCNKKRKKKQQPKIVL